MSPPLYDLETRAEWRAVRLRSAAYADALGKIPPFDDTATNDGDPLNPTSLVKVPKS